MRVINATSDVRADAEACRLALISDGEILYLHPRGMYRLTRRPGRVPLARRTAGPTTALATSLAAHLLARQGVYA